MENLKTFLFLCCALGVMANELPDSIPRCGRKDNNLADCVKNYAASIFPFATKGFPEKNIPPLDPLMIDSLNSKPKDSNSVFRVEQQYKNLRVRGISGAIFKNIKVSLAKDKCEIKIRSVQPFLEIYGDYKVDGKALLFTLNGHGKANITGTDVLTKSVINCEFYMKNNEEYLRFTNMTINMIDMKTTYLYLENVFEGNPELSKAINEVLNENAKDVLKDLSGGFTDKFAEVELDAANKFIDGIPTSKLFLN